MPEQGATLDLAMIGNCCISALIDARGRIVWCCLPRFDGEPVFHSLIGSPPGAHDGGLMEVTLDGLKSSRQSYVRSTAVVQTVLHGEAGSIEITDFAPRFRWRERNFRPQTLIRRIRPLSGSPRIRIRVRPSFDFGRGECLTASGSNHIRYLGRRLSLRLSTDAPIDFVASETPFILDAPINLVLGPDETLEGGVGETARSFEERTIDYWREWVHRLALPLEWQEAVIRAAITLKMCSYEPTGAIVAAMTTSIPEAAGSGRNWDYRFCWVRDAFFVVRALNSLAAVRTLELYFRWLMNIVASSENGNIQPVYGIGLETKLTELTVPELAGYRGMGPVRAGNQAHEQIQHDTYGNIILGATQAFFDHRLYMTPGVEEFRRFEAVGEQAFHLYDKPDAGMWELRSRARPHTSSAIMSWAGCDRLAKIAHHIGRPDRAVYWRAKADEVRAAILEHSWSDQRKSFVESFGGRHLDGSVLLMGEVGMISGSDPRFVATVDALEHTLGRGPFMMRYEEADDFGVPETAFNVCAFWRLDALARIGRRDEAREIFEALLASRNSHGLMSEDTDPATGEAWGNFPQTYSMVGIINGAMRLSKSWESTV
ncbi:MAG: glycoside hydrolase family 15 protein [Hyphomicrobiaceae bacterium]|nr:glycoside hydrolase family 15 protein [Hyphomicrobiaceae bacterium]